MMGLPAIGGIPMKKRIFVLVFGLALPLIASPKDKETSPVTSVLDKFNKAYNAHDLEAVMAFFTPDSMLIEFPDKIAAKGIEEIRKRYTARLAEPNLHVDVTNRIAIGDKVIDHERIVRTFPEGPGIWNIVSIIEVKDGHVIRFWFIDGGKTLTAAVPVSVKSK
jgi:uncharacterized protein (TIGR02246 family)